jgi:hypothetical protein
MKRVRYSNFKLHAIQSDHIGRWYRAEVTVRKERWFRPDLTRKEYITKREGQCWKTSAGIIVNCELLHNLVTKFEAYEGKLLSQMKVGVYARG